MKYVLYIIASIGLSIIITIILLSQLIISEIISEDDIRIVLPILVIIVNTAILSLLYKMFKL